MNILVLGATGATGKLLTQQLLERNQNVKVIVRSAGSLPEKVRDHKNLTIIEAGILDLDKGDLTQHVYGCDAVASCLGHNLSLKGVFGPPYKLVTEVVKRVCEAIKETDPDSSVKFVLMSSAGVSNQDLQEPVTVAHKLIVGAVRLLVPPHSDNEQAADYLRSIIGQDNQTSQVIEWTAVRPDGLINESRVSEYDTCPSPIRSAITNPGKTSRINVAHFMADLITEDEIWQQWKGRMPVIYNRS
jgi:putative NADH-flavin reductase